MFDWTEIQWHKWNHKWNYLITLESIARVGSYRRNLERLLWAVSIWIWISPFSFSFSFLLSLSLSAFFFCWWLLSRTHLFSLGASISTERRWKKPAAKKEPRKQIEQTKRNCSNKTTASPTTTKRCRIIQLCWWKISLGADLLQPKTIWIVSIHPLVKFGREYRIVEAIKSMTQFRQPRMHFFRKLHYLCWIVPSASSHVDIICGDMF